MKLISGWISFLLNIFLFAAFVAGFFIQIYESFYIGTAVVVVTLSIELMREISRTEKKRKLRWMEVVGLCFGVAVSVAVLLVSLLFAAVLGNRSFYILLLDSSLSTVVFLLSSFLRFWKYLKM
jgi:uncharacterized membrane protein